MNSSYSLGSLSEEALESNNKFVRRYLEQFSRKICPTEQLKDAFSRLLERSDPVIIFHQRRFKNLRFCTICNCSHHLTKNHDKYSDKMEKSKVVNEYDRNFNPRYCRISLKHLCCSFHKQYLSFNVSLQSVHIFKKISCCVNRSMLVFICVLIMLMLIRSDIMIALLFFFILDVKYE